LLLGSNLFLKKEKTKYSQQGLGPMVYYVVLSINGNCPCVSRKNKLEQGILGFIHASNAVPKVLLTITSIGIIFHFSYFIIFF